jgi:PIN domain nuclease of toxin-antitoxin system
MPSGSEAQPLLLDTHYWIWLQSGTPGKFTTRLRASIEAAAASGLLLLSVISVWELALLEAKGRIELTSSCADWVKSALATPGLVLAPLTPEIAIDSTRLPEPFHGDPADRIIVATARRTGARLATRDAKMREFALKHRIAVA